MKNAAAGNGAAGRLDHIDDFSGPKTGEHIMPKTLKEMLDKLKRPVEEPSAKPRDYFQRPKIPEGADKAASGDWSGSAWSGERFSGRNMSGGRGR